MINSLNAKKVPSFSYTRAACTATYSAARRRRNISTAAGRNCFSTKITAMRAVVQRVASASVEVEGRIVSAIGPGLLVLVGLHESDVESDADYICRKVSNMRLFPNAKTGKTWDRNVMQENLEVLLVSQFTLYGVLKGNKPDFHVAMPPEKARTFYDSVVERFRKAYKPDAVKDGIFGAMMKVNLVNDGPVTMQLESATPSRNTEEDEATE